MIEGDNLSYGPSPRGRGNLLRGPMAGRPDGAIPAWAGEPISECSIINSIKGHPRVGGGTSA